MLLGDLVIDHMKEKDWLSCTDPIKMLRSMRGKTSDRKLRLFASACCRRVSHFLKDKTIPMYLEMLLEVGERIAEGTATPQEVYDAVHDADVIWNDVAYFKNAETDSATALRSALDDRATATSAAKAVSQEAAHALSHEGKQTTEEGNQCQLLRDIFGYPFRPVSLDPSWLAWNDGIIVKLAHAIYDERAFDRLPILADALEEAGCTNTDILNHCRQPSEHVRGCWVVDLILGRS